MRLTNLLTLTETYGKSDLRLMTYPPFKGVSVSLVSLKLGAEC